MAAGEAMVVIAPPEPASIIEERLRTRGLDAPACKAAGRLQTIDAAGALEQFMIGEEPDWGRFLSEVGGAVARGIALSTSGRVRAYGEMVDLLWRRGRKPREGRVPRRARPRDAQSALAHPHGPGADEAARRRPRHARAWGDRAPDPPPDPPGRRPARRVARHPGRPRAAQAARRPARR